MISVLDGIKVRLLAGMEQECNNWTVTDSLIAMVTKVSARMHGGAVRLKAAASFAEAGDIHDIVDELWKGPGEKKQTLIDTVSAYCIVPLSAENTNRHRKLIFSSNGQIKCPWSHTILYPTLRPLWPFRYCTTAW
jgi:hypothetical protein